jgi:hypothetical protein
MTLTAAVSISSMIALAIAAKAISQRVLLSVVGRPSGRHQGGRVTSVGFKASGPDTI